MPDTLPLGLPGRLSEVMPRQSEHVQGTTIGRNFILKSQRTAQRNTIYTGIYPKDRNDVAPEDGIG
ncbi:hypothetical protein [Deinococcus xianganensis]|uniref:Uncharacterized protein n=1 Tax=Deinococcus xianganensis TaxID=1507289 RepID=A0A6I4YE00_9DEIO|nr:hypothetical protein [Deinococcus xianganensis]MXV19752.1 hypothetical protein [Deinococcus xianganensis]